MGVNFKDLIYSYSDGSLFLATDKVIVRSFDEGQSWTKLSLLTPESDSSINAIAVNPQNSDEIFYVTNTSFYRSFDTPVVTLRPFNTYGPRQSARAVIPTIIAQALTQDRVQLGNLDARRDLTYVADTVAGFLQVGQTSGVEGETFNLGSGEEISIGDLAQQVLTLIGRDVKITIDAERLRPEKSEVQRLLSDNRLARERLGWQPTVQIGRAHV